jgi:hypothetical protein
VRLKVDNLLEAATLIEIHALLGNGDCIGQVGKDRCVDLNSGRVTSTVNDWKDAHTSVWLDITSIGRVVDPILEISLLKLAVFDHIDTLKR